MTILIADKRQHLRALVEKEIERLGNGCDLNHIDVSQVEDFSYSFTGLPFHGDVSRWNVGNGRKFDGMFERTQFNGDISHWDMHRARTMDDMFCRSPFNGDLSRWSMPLGPSINGAFIGTPFSGDLSHWRTSTAFGNACAPFSAHFNGCLPRVEGGAPGERRLFSDPLECMYGSMFGSMAALYEHLKRTPFGPVHAQLCMEESIGPWLSRADYDWAIGQMHAASLMGMDRATLCEMLPQMHAMHRSGALELAGLRLDEQAP